MWNTLITHGPITGQPTSNLASQGYFEQDLHKIKVEATALLCKQINSTTELFWLKHAFRRSREIGDTVFCAVDDISTRQFIWEAVKGKVGFFVDGRMTAEILRVLTACDFDSRKHYPTSLFRIE